MEPKVNCWEDRQCGYEPGGPRAEDLGPCPAATDTSCDGINGGRYAGRLCWTIAGPPCGEQTPAAQTCRTCSFFRRVKYEEGIHFQVLKLGLGTRDLGILHRRLNDVVAMMTVYRDILASLAVRPLLSRIAEHACAITRWPAAGVYLLPSDGEELVLAARAGTVVPPQRIALDGPVPPATAVRDMGLTQGESRADGNEEALLYVAMPIGGQQGPAGVLYLAGQKEPLSADDEWFLRELALAAGLGIRSAELIESLRDLRSVDRAKSRFVSLLMHEIGAPLATIACSLTALSSLQGTLSDQDREQLIQGSIDRVDTIQALAKKLLHLAAIRAGSCLKEIRSVSVGEILGEEVAARRTQARQQGVEVLLEVAAQEARVSADPDGLRLVLANLLDNAIKYSGGPGKTVTARLEAESKTVRISICDEGVGISQEEQARVFEEFHRARQASDSSVPGFGLGLAFVRELVQSYEGRIDLASVPGRGTTVTVEFPAVADQASGDGRRTVT